MPSSLTHYFFNKEVFDNNINYLKGNEDIYSLGNFYCYGYISEPAE